MSSDKKITSELITTNQHIPSIYNEIIYPIKQSDRFSEKFINEYIFPMYSRIIRQTENPDKITDLLASLNNSKFTEEFNTIIVPNTYDSNNTLSSFYKTN
ncbi:Hypothetical protein SRAE_1000046100 [Strongyloides ratti]|uniref:Uncharacterized protein n=1 Tax=Strongyloides ratti TaxID=34506 RepID=A0A090L292_STRRB|nr:Hypothetical protein SRAE_1000046100 [Strongyloides ratti]CEF62187.1 Hypothetical protein SRAE_1000046100 [Strongyloides ratti]